MLHDIPGIVAGVLALVTIGAWLRSRAHRVPPAEGDRELARQLDAVVGRGTRSVAVAVIDRRVDPAARFAFVDAGAQTRFEIGSITKALTGLLLAQAIERGELSLGTTIGDILPVRSGPRGVGGAIVAGRPRGWRDRSGEVAPGRATRPVRPLLPRRNRATLDPKDRLPLRPPRDRDGFAAITMQELCTHTSGLPRLPVSPAVAVRILAQVVLGLDPYRGADPPRVLRLAARQRLARRGRYRYSNLGASVLGQLLAVVAGTDFATLLHDRVLDPIGMHDAFVATRGHSALRGWSAAGRRAQPWVADGYAPAGGVVADIEDMARLAIGLLAGTAPGGDALQPIEGVAGDRPDRASGMFWVIDEGRGPDRKVIWHNGQTGGYSSFLALYPAAQRAVVVLADTASAARPQRIALGLVRARWSGPAVTGR